MPVEGDSQHRDKQRMFIAAVMADEVVSIRSEIGCTLASPLPHIEL